MTTQATWDELSRCAYETAGNMLEMMRKFNAEHPGPEPIKPLDEQARMEFAQAILAIAIERKTKEESGLPDWLEEDDETEEKNEKTDYTWLACFIGVLCLLALGTIADTVVKVFACV